MERQPPAVPPSPPEGGAASRLVPPPFATLARFVARACAEADERVVLRAADGVVARVGFALEPWPGLAAWARETRLDVLFLHRHWRLDLAAVPRRVGVIASHDGFDRRYGFGDPVELLAALAVPTRVAHLPDRDGWPLGVVAEGAPRPFDAFVRGLHDVFGGVEEVVPPARDASSIGRIAVSRAMTDALVREAAARGARVYVTGQRRAPARDAVRDTGVGVVAVGHARAERWALGRLAAAVGAAWGALAVHVAPPDAD